MYDIHTYEFQCTSTHCAKYHQSEVVCHYRIIIHVVSCFYSLKLLLISFNTFLQSDSIFSLCLYINMYINHVELPIILHRNLILLRPNMFVFLQIVIKILM